MAPPEKTFSVSEIEHRLHFYENNYKTKVRKLPKNFDLKRDCTLHELVQYSCTTAEELEIRALLSGPSQQKHCHPFVRLFRRCKDVHGQEFNVETTAWEGRHRWKKLDEKTAAAKLKTETRNGQSTSDNKDKFAVYGDYFWSGR